MTLQSIVGVAVLASGSSIHASVSNGSFEAPPIAAGTFVTYSAGSTALTGWTVTGIDASVVSTNLVSGGLTFNAQDGNQWVDLTGPGTRSPANGVRQIVATTVGQRYRLSFYVGSGTDNVTFGASTVDVSINGGGRTGYTNTITPLSSINWQQFTTQFVATGATTSITFLNGSIGGNDLCALDNVTLQAIAPCGLSDVAGPDQSVSGDGLLTADDVIVFLAWFFASDPRANIAGANQSTTPDASFTADDIIVFLSLYFGGC